MTLLNEQQCEQVAAAIAEVEATTDAELVTVLAKLADNYYYIPILWSALIAMTIPILLQLTPFWLNASDLIAAQWGVFILFALLFRIPKNCFA